MSEPSLVEADADPENTTTNCDSSAVKCEGLESWRQASINPQIDACYVAR
jgi:hypothetical protein